ncbi:MAG: glycoside hydrolase family 97 protein [Prevotella sp.]
MKKLILTLLAAIAVTISYAKSYTVKSPDGQLTITVNTGDKTTWSINHGETIVLLPSEIGMETSNGHYGRKVRIKNAKSGKTDKTFNTGIYKKAEVRDNYHWLTINTAEGYAMTFRAYNDGAAYRFETTAAGNMIVKNETSEYHFDGDYKTFVPYVNDNRGGEKWCYSFESYYDEAPLSAMFADSLSITPLAVCLPNGMKAVIMDCGVEDYPGMYLVKGEGNSLTATFPQLPTNSMIGGYARLNLVPEKRADYIAECISGKGKSVAFPWRTVLVTTSDSQLLDNDMAQRLAPECRIEDTSWIKPGKVAWDWWNNTNLTGVDFVAGMNTDTYKYYIDFASANALEYIIIDEGWSDSESLMKLSDKIDLSTLVGYAESKDVGIILWSSWRNMIKDMESTMEHYSRMGIKGFKVDFFDRDDQEAVNSVYAIAKCAADNHLLLDLHGLKPMGVQRAYPNIINFEGVKGLENSKWEPRTATGPVHDQPRYDVTAPYLRMLPGPMDYTPGAMTNATKDKFFGNNNHPMSQGTRVHQMAMYTIFEAPLQMLADSPTRYEKEQECTDFIAKVPTVFDETVALDGVLGEYIVMARRKGNVWYIAAMNNWTPRTVTIDISRLKGLGTKAVIFSDGVNAAKDASDYKRTETTIDPTTCMKVDLAPAGGWTAIVE